jgi:hypothetical protein
VGYKHLFYGGKSWQMWIVPITKGITRNARYLAHTRTGIRKNIIACPAVIGKAVPITPAEVTKKKYQKRFGQILICRK